MMRIGIYVEVATGERPTGIGKHIISLVSALATIDSSNQYLLYHSTPVWGRKEQLSFCPTQTNIRSRPVRFPRQWIYERPRLWWNKYLPAVLRRDGIDVFHGPNHFSPRWDRNRSVVTIHDLAYFFMNVHGDKMDHAMRKWTLHAFEHARRVIALSENTQRDVERLGVSSDRIRVIYGGGNIVDDACIAWNRIAEMRQRRKLPAKYVLYVGAIQPRKNLPLLVRAYALMRKRYQISEQLVLVGPQESATKEVVAIATELGIEKYLHLTGYLDDWEIPLIYNEASIFTLPSLYEGFTLVTLEAMAYGTPVVAMNNSSIREGVGDAGLLVESDNIEAYAVAMHGAIIDHDLRGRLISRGRERASQFTWTKCAQQTLRLYQEIYKETTYQKNSNCRACAV